MTLLSNPTRIPIPTGSGHLHRLTTLLQAAGLRGHGGAGFPTATKISAVAGHRPRMIINLCDGEPLVHKDATLFAGSAGLVVDGAALVAQAVGAREVIFAAHHGSATLAQLRALLPAEAHLFRHVDVLAVPPRYVASEESALASMAVGESERPGFRSQPLVFGGPGRGRVPVLVLNAETCAQMAQLWARLLAGETAPRLSSRLVTVAGAVVRPGVVEVPLGRPVSDVVWAAGGPTDRPRAVLLGGFGGSWLRWQDAERLALSPESAAAAGVSLGAGLLYLQPVGECPHRLVQQILDYLAGESAGQCGPCMFGLPAVAADWGQLVDRRLGPSAWDRLQRRMPVIAGRGACRHPDGAMRQAASALDVFGSHLKSHWSGRCAGNGRHPDPVTVGAAA
ncbi:NADH-ubiquinone oxidoreductase-F iron-sulfur binding region domain-containing protein [Microlunatus panaciterrae]|uniref:NADH:ubiquinone oxidoreductase subunit F (NADH-binding) n=1 Tax=Microlunatus panaciterrae TaxID=400768 RepID=A0ABS2RHS4_9ACTN|nr:NADH-ubiquinone oxidoreductase-F iron-sulfur binding region domain-containing protein [Microlunatus panaciterrae]MBM7798102.1 NADH:ubiquinone oxidoreductase subunit F (NADH-binding) [Microlunatus panaciterrae]